MQRDYDDGAMKRYWWIGVLVVVRLAVALTFPVFNDEAIYAQWSQAVVDHGAMGLTAMLMDGKQPGALMVWSIGQWLMGEWQPFLVLRLMSIGFGWLTAVIAWKLLTELTGQAPNWWQRLIFVLNPGLVWYESLGLQEALVMTSAISTIYIAVLYERGKLKKYPAWWVGVILGFLVGVSWWIKPTAMIAVPAVIYVGLRWCRLKDWIMLSLTAGMLVSLVWLHPAVSVFWAAAADRMGRGFEWIRLCKNVVWILWWVGPLAPIGIWWVVKRKQWLIAGVMLVGLLMPVFSGLGIYTSRYVAAVFPLAVVAGLGGLNKTMRWIQLGWSLLVVGGLWVQPLGLYRLSDLIPPVREDLSQYMENWTSGWGVAEAIKYVDEIVTNKQKVVMVRQDAGNPESAMMAAFWHRKDVVVLTDVNWGRLEQLVKQGAQIEAVLVSRDSHSGLIPASSTELMQKFERPLDSGYVGVWRLRVD
jgi:hypothetical protein